jgi:hypothetical protein
MSRIAARLVMKSLRANTECHIANKNTLPKWGTMETRRLHRRLRLLEKFRSDLFQSNTVDILLTLRYISWSDRSEKIREISWKVIRIPRPTFRWTIRSSSSGNETSAEMENLTRWKSWIIFHDAIRRKVDGHSSERCIAEKIESMLNMSSLFLRTISCHNEH